MFRLGGGASRCRLVNSGLGSNVSRWLVPPFMNREMTALAFGGKCGFLGKSGDSSGADEARRFSSPKISAVFSRTPARPFSFRAGAARLRILSYETVEAEHRRTTPFVVYSGIVFLLFLRQPSFARLFVFAPASRAVRWRNGVRQI